MFESGVASSSGSYELRDARESLSRIWSIPGLPVLMLFTSIGIAAIFASALLFWRQAKTASPNTGKSIGTAKNFEVSKQDLAKAFALCQLNRDRWSTQQKWIWRTEAWSDVVAIFGKPKSEALYDNFKSLCYAYFSINKPVGKGLVEEAKAVSQEFRESHPSAPESLIQYFEDEHMFQNR